MCVQLLSMHEERLSSWLYNRAIQGSWPQACMISLLLPGACQADGQMMGALALS